jgi:hypothetical protein
LKVQNLVFYEVLRDPTLSSLAKYDRFAKLKHVDSKKQLFVRGVYWASPGPPPTSCPNRRLERGRGRGWKEAGREAGREAWGEAGGEAEREAGREAGEEAGAGMEVGRLSFVRNIL